MNPTSASDAIVQEITIKAPAERIFEALTNPDERLKWIAGEYRNIERPRLLVFTWLPDWQEDATETLVRWDLKEKGGVSTVRLTHSGFTSEGSRATYRRWPQVLGGLQAYIERQV
jgi:uncharacterized protein YndB with AHSA1/START domain